MIRNFDNFEVAVINYPLMNPLLKVGNYSEFFGLDYSSLDKWGIPLYIHIPFCSKICKFCIYNRQLPDKSGDIVQQYVDMLIHEIKLYGETPYVSSMNIGSVFIGGGTPTCLSKKQMTDILAALHKYLPIKKGIEITVECNIVNADYEMLSVLKNGGVTRISTGVQTFSDSYRSLLGMPTSCDDVLNWIAMAESFGFNEVSIDLLYGLPGQTLREWEQDLTQAVKLPITHFSIYKLALFAYTALYKEIEKGNAPPLPAEDIAKDMFLFADNFFEAAGYVMQSCQEYCCKESRARFWDLTYDGFGDNLSFGAFSFGYINGFSYQNCEHVKDYIEKLKNGSLPVKMVSEKITRRQLMERAVILGFRHGYVEKEPFLKMFGESIQAVFPNEISDLIENGLIEENDTHYCLTKDGRFYQGNVSAKFMVSSFDGVSPLKKKMAVGMHIVPGAI
jgi:oxygen-independent coproporphyrinogen III oxidase